MSVQHSKHQNQCQEDRWCKLIEWKRMIPAQTALSSVQRVEWMKYCNYQISNIVIIKCQTLLARGLNIYNIVVIKLNISRVGFGLVSK